MSGPLHMSASVEQTSSLCDASNAVRCFLHDSLTKCVFLFLGGGGTRWRNCCKEAVNFVVFVRPSVSAPITGLPLDGFSLNLIFLKLVFENTSGKIRGTLKFDKNNRHFTWRLLYIYGNISLDSSIERKMFQTNVVDKIITHILWSKFLFFFFENRAVYVKKWGKNCIAGRATDDNMAHAHCVLST